MPPLRGEVGEHFVPPCGVANPAPRRHVDFDVGNVDGAPVTDDGLTEFPPDPDKAREEPSLKKIRK